MTAPFFGAEAVMNRKRVLGTIMGGAALLGACTMGGGDKAVQTAMPADFGFHFLDEGSDAKLAYGQANSDNVGLMLQCEKGSRMVAVSDMVRSSPTPTLTLVSGKASSTVKVAIEPGPGAAVAVGQAPVATPALTGFRKSGKLAVSYAGLRYDMTAKPNEQASVQRFFAACEKA